MPARDLFHNAVIVALQKDGWKITHDPLHLRYGKIDLYVDLGAEKLLAAQKNDEKVAIEIKSFISPSFVNEFHTTLGQYLNYRLVLQEIEPERRLFLAITDDVYQEYFYIPFVAKVIEFNKINFLIYDPIQQKIMQWIK
jgi:hypothetical protein